MGWMDYKGLDVPAEGQRGEAGRKLAGDLRELADRAPYWADRAPTADDDETQGFSPGSLWLDVSTQIFHICITSSPSTSVWRPLFLRTSTSLILLPTDATSAIQRDSGGNARGQGAVDFQTQRFDDSLVASGNFAFVSGKDNIAYGQASHAEGICTSSQGDASHSEGYSTVAYGWYSHAEGEFSISFASAGHAEGYFCRADGYCAAHAEGAYTCASEQGSHAEGSFSLATGFSSHAEGYFAISSGSNSHAEGNETLASGTGSHSEGDHTISSGLYSHAEGEYTVASGAGSHAEGYSTTASGHCGSHAEGSDTTAYGYHSHSEGIGTLAFGAGSHAEGAYSLANLPYQHSQASGRFTSIGDAQFSRKVSRALTTDDTPTELSPGDRLLLSPNSTWSYFIQASARRTGTNDEAAGYEFRGVITKMSSAASTRIVGSTKFVLGEDTPAWDMNVTADTTNGSLKLEVVGETGKSVRWVATSFWTQVVTVVED